MDIEYILFWIVFSVAIGIAYYHFAIKKKSSLNDPAENPAMIWKIQKEFLLSHVKFILGIVLIALSQYNLSTLPPPLPYVIGELVYSSRPLIELPKLHIPDPVTTLANYLALLAGCFLIISTLRDLNVFPKEKVSIFSLGSSLGFPKGRVLLLKVFGFVLVFHLLWQLYNQSKETYLVGVWLVVILIFGYLAARMDYQKGVFVGPHIRRADAIWLVTLFLLGLIIGMYRLQNLPDQFIGDEGSFWDLASKTASGEVRPLFFDNGVYSFPNLSSIGQAFVLMIFGISVWSWRFSSLLAGLLTIIPLYLLARELFGRQIAVVSCILMVTLEYFLAFSRMGYNNSQTLFPVTLALYFVVMSIKRNSILYLYLTGCATGLGFYTYTASRSALVIITLFVVTFLLQNRKSKRNIFKVAAIVALGWFVFVSPLLVFSSVHSPESTTQKLKESIFFHTDFTVLYTREQIINDPGTTLSADGAYFFNPRIYAELIARGFLRSLLSFNIAAGLVSEHFITAPLAGIAGAAFFTIGMLISLARFWERGHYLLLYWFIVNIVLLSTLTTFPPRHQHMVSVIPLIALWTGLGLVSTVKGLSYTYLHNHKFQAVLITALTIGLALTGLYSYFVRMPIIYRPGPEQIMSWAALYAQDEKIVYVYASPEESQLEPYVMQYIHQDFPYSAVPINRLAAELDSRTIVFFPPSIAAPVKRILEANRLEIRTQRTFYNSDDNALLEGVANFDTGFGAPRGLSAYLSESYLSPGLWLILLMVIFLVFLIGFRPSWMEYAPSWVKGAYLWVISESPYN